MSLTSRKTDHADPPSSEEQLKHKALELFRNKVDAIEPLMRTTCHGLNNHLTRLLMHSELLGMLTGGDVTPKVSERLKQIQEEIETISCLVKGFRLVGRNGLQDYAKRQKPRRLSTKFSEMQSINAMARVNNGGKPGFQFPAGWMIVRSLSVLSIAVPPLTHPCLIKFGNPSSPPKKQR